MPLGTPGVIAGITDLALRRKWPPSPATRFCTCFYKVELLNAWLRQHRAQLAIVEAVRLLREVRGSSLALYSAGCEPLPYLMVPGLNVEMTIRELGQGKIAAALARVRQADAELQ